MLHTSISLIALSGTGALAAGARLLELTQTIDHLSPLLRYEPADAWNHTLYGSHTTTPGAGVTFHHWGNQLDINDLGYTATPPTDGVRYSASPTFEQYPETWFHPTSESTQTSENGTVNGHRFLTGINGYSSRYAWRNVSIALPENVTMDLPEAERTLNVTRLRWSYPMPVDKDWTESFSGGNPSIPARIDRASVEHEPTVWSNNETNSEFYTLQGEWYVAELNNTLRLSADSVYGPSSMASPGYQGNEWRDRIAQFLNTTLLRLNSSSAEQDASLHFTVLNRTSRLMIHGSVGPDMGQMSISLTPTSASDSYDNVPIANLSGTPSGNGYVYEIDTYRPVEATGQMLLNVPVDARAQYEVTIRPVWPEDTDDVRRLDLNGANFATYVTEDDGWYEDDWVADANRELEYRMGWRSRPVHLSGGQIAGIVVGSVAGIVLLVGTCFLCRRERRKQDLAVKQRRGSDDDQRTITSSPSGEASNKV